MTPEQWQQVKPIFHAALERPAHERAAFLDEACAGDTALGARIEALLAAHEDTGSFLAQPAIAEVVPHLFNETIELSAGQKLGGYEIQRKLGQGGMGEVYLARDSQLGRLVALKVLLANFTREPDRVRRFQQEARAASALNHPNILTIYEVGQADGIHFIVTEYIEGATLRALLQRGELTLGEVLDIVIQAGQALEASHRAGIVHRDIKPENLMRRKDGFVKVLDFGLAKLTERPAGWATAEFSRFRTRSGVVMGTVTYMSPEQARGQEVDARSDVFSLGVVLYEMLTGHVPFDGESMSDVIAALLEREPASLDSYISGLPATFQTIVTRALQKQREARYANISELLADLRALKDELEITAKLKRSGKTKLADTSLLEMRVGQSQGQVGRTTNERQGRTTARFSTAVVWVKSRPVLMLVSVLLLALVGFAVQAWYSGKLKFERGSLGAIDSVAVLPFVDNTNDAQLNYLPDGLTESLINNLSRLSNLRVMASGSVFQYKNRAESPIKVGQDLKVSSVLSGRIQKAGDKLRINLELADARNGARLWGQQYERPLSDLVVVQSEIIHEVTQQLRLRLSGEQEQRLTRSQPTNSEAYQNYLKGRFQFVQYTRASQEKALEFFQKAIEADPGYALAYTGIADFYSEFSGQYLLPSEAMPKAKAAARRALELDPALAEGHHSLALIQWWDDWDFPAAEAEFKRTLELNPNAAITMPYFSQFLIQMKRMDEALTWAQRAMELDPLSTHASHTMGLVRMAQRRYDLALSQARKTQELHPNYMWAYSLAGQALALQGRHNEALAEIQRGVTINPHDALRSVQGYLLALAGQPNETRKILADLEKQAQRRLVAPSYLARVYAGLRETDRTLECLRRAYDDHSDHVLWLGDHYFDYLRTDARFITLLKQIGLPQ